MRGRLIVVEGLDGVGKSTLSRGLADALGAAWRTTPSEALRAHRGAFDAAYRDIPAASQLFYAASVVAAGAEADALRAAGRDVVIDRYWSSTLAYARAAGSKLDLCEVEDLLPAADVTLLVELPEDERRARLLSRGASEMDRSTLDPTRMRRLQRELRQALSRRVAGCGRLLDVSGLDPAGAVAAALALVDDATDPDLFQMSAK
jgi:dTMP kinase